MKRYLLFFGMDYYPAGGWSDFKGDFDTIEEADARFQQFEKSSSSLNGRWYQIIDTTNKLIVRELNSLTK